MLKRVLLVMCSYLTLITMTWTQHSADHCLKHWSWFLLHLNVMLYIYYVCTVYPAKQPQTIAPPPPCLTVDGSGQVGVKILLAMLLLMCNNLYVLQNVLSSQAWLQSVWGLAIQSNPNSRFVILCAYFCHICVIPVFVSGAMFVQRCNMSAVQLLSEQQELHRNQNHLCLSSAAVDHSGLHHAVTWCGWPFEKGKRGRGGFL